MKDSLMSDELFSTDSVDRDSLETSPGIDAEGWYHLQVRDVTPHLEKEQPEDPKNPDGPKKEATPHILLQCEVMMNVKGQSPMGRSLFHRLYTASKGGGPAADGTRNSNIRFLTGIGAMKWQEIDGKQIAVDLETGKPSVTLNTFTRCKGKHFIAKVEFEPPNDPKYKGKYTIPFGRVYQIGDPKVAGVPYNKEIIALETGMAKTGFEGPGSDLPADL